MFETLRHQAFRVFGREPAILGLWERIGDEFAGCTVLVERAVDGIRGRVTHVTPTMRRLGWEVGDVKWTGITPAGHHVYRLKDLFKSFDRTSDTLLQENYRSSHLRFFAEDRFYVVADEGAAPPKTCWQRLDAPPGPST